MDWDGGIHGQKYFFISETEKWRKRIKRSCIFGEIVVK